MLRRILFPNVSVLSILLLGILAGAAAGCGSDSHPESPVVATPGELLADPPTPIALDDGAGSGIDALDEAARAVFDRDVGLVRRRIDLGAGGHRIDTVLDIAWVDGAGRFTSRLDYDRRLAEDPDTAEILAEMEEQMVDVALSGDELTAELAGSADAMIALWTDIDVSADPSGRWATDVAAPATPGRLDVVVADGMISEAERTFTGMGLDITSGDRWDVLE